MKLKKILWVVFCCLLTTLFLNAENNWQPLGDGTLPPIIGSWPNMTGPQLCWLPGHNFAVIAPILTEKEGKEHPGIRKISYENPAWTFVPGKLPARMVPDMWDSPRGYCYLPKLGKILLLKKEWPYASDKTKVVSWLLDPVDASWEPLPSTLMMRDNSADFNPSQGIDGLSIPIWGTLCYDPHNGEAVAFGGAGIWGRVGAEIENVKTGDWIYDEAVKRVRRLTPDDGSKITKARKWYPGHSGTWLFSEQTKEWKALPQPLSAQPGSRILPAMAYDSDAKKIILFGGDDLARCLNDTWSYDCQTRTWSLVKTKNRPTARAAAALVYEPTQKRMLLIGGYRGGWNPLKDVWAFNTATAEWQKLPLDLPHEAGHASADYVAEKGEIILAAYPGTSGNKKIPIYTLKLDLAKLSPVVDEAPDDPKLDYHCRAGRRVTWLPGEWFEGEGALENEAEVRAEFKALPANKWHHIKPPKVVRERNWGTYIYDTKTHRAFAWGGGHSAYPGAEISEFYLLGKRWREMEDPTNYNPVWLHGMVSGPPGATFGGWGFLPTHARRSYGIDPISQSVITYIGDVYSTKHHMFVANIGKCPGKYDVSTQVAFVTAPHGLYGYSSGLLVRANVAAGRWDEVTKGGPPNHHENSYITYDSIRDKLIYFYINAQIWTYDFKTETWQEENVVGNAPPTARGDATFIPELDAACLVFAEEKNGAEKLYFYKPGEHKWYTAPSEGDPFAGSHSGARDWSPHWDSELGLLVRITPQGFATWLNVHVMRLDPATIKLSPL